MKTNTYIDNLPTRNMVKIDKDGYTGYFYEDLFWGEWVGNFNLVKGNKNLIHATLVEMPADLESFMAKMITSYERRFN